MFCQAQTWIYWTNNTYYFFLIQEVLTTNKFPLFENELQLQNGKDHENLESILSHSTEDLQYNVS